MYTNYAHRAYEHAHSFIESLENKEPGSRSLGQAALNHTAWGVIRGRVDLLRPFNFPRVDILEFWPLPVLLLSTPEIFDLWTFLKSVTWNLSHYWYYIDNVLQHLIIIWDNTQSHLLTSLFVEQIAVFYGRPFYYLSNYTLPILFVAWFQWPTYVLSLWMFLAFKKSSATFFKNVVTRFLSFSWTYLKVLL